MRLVEKWVFVLWAVFFSQVAYAQEVLVEAEGFQTHGGWKLDTQSIEAMGSPYLLAHGLGNPVDDAMTTVTFYEPGVYRVFVRTKDWVARWDAPGHPGRFQVVVDGTPLKEMFGTQGAQWFWHDGGTVNIQAESVEVSLHDLTGFEGRCDAILFSKSGTPPPNESEILSQWRRERLNLPAQPTEKSGYDLVVVGGGYSGMGAAISAARMGCKVALIQNRPVLGGNGSSEVRVWAQGLIRRGRYPRIGEIIEELSDHATKSPGAYEEFEDAKKERIVREEGNIDLFLNQHAFKVDMQDKQIVAVYALNTRTSQRTRFVGQLFVDCTGHGTIGFLAGADWEMTPKGRMGMSNMWTWDESDTPVAFPETPWALDLEMADFPYPRRHHAEWFWESGFDQDPLQGAEAIRDWNLRAAYGAFNAMKNRGGADQHENAFLTWMAYIGGPRESRRLMGDVLLTQEDVVEKREFPDGCVPSTWAIDLHYAKKQYAKKFPANPFISKAQFDQRVDRAFGFPVPYRCFYSRNISNLFMAGRCISVTHQALGTTRVMKTCGMMGEVVGKAASLCRLHDCLPRAVYERYWEEMDELLKLPGKAHRETVRDEIVIPSESLPLANKFGSPRRWTGLSVERLAGVVVDNNQAETTGTWTKSSNLEGFVGRNYLYAANNSDASIRYKLEIPQTGRFDLRIAYQAHENRGSRVPVTVEAAGQSKQVTVNMQKAPPMQQGFFSIGRFNLNKGEPVFIVLTTENAGGYVHADAVQAVRVD